MAIPSVSTSSQALASYAAQLQAIPPRSHAQNPETKTREQDDQAQNSDRVTLSARSRQEVAAPGEPGSVRNNDVDDVDRAADAQSVERGQTATPEETRAASGKSVTQALEAYVQTSLI